MTESSAPVAPAATRSSDASPGDPVSLQILVKALAAAAAAVAASSFGPEAAAASAVVATIVADSVKELVKRRRWGKKRVAALIALVLLFNRVDSALARAVRRPRARTVTEGLAGQRNAWLRGVATTAAGLALAVVAVTATEAARGAPLGSADREFTFFGSDRRPDPQPIARPGNRVPPTIAGTATAGETLRGHVGAWSGRPTPEYALQWLRCDAAGDDCRAIEAATGGTHRLTEADVGATIRLEVTASNTAGRLSLRAAPTATVTATPRPDVAPANRQLPAIDGDATVDHILHGDVGRWTGRPTPTFELRWLRCDATGERCRSIAGATEATYQLTAADVRSTVRLTVTASNSEGSKRARSPATASVSDAVVANIAPTNVEPPKITGTPTVGETLRARNGRWNGRPAPDYDVQWLRCDRTGGGCSTIVGATEANYRLTGDEVGASIRVRVTATNSEGSKWARSVPTEPVTAEPRPDIKPNNVEAPAITGTPTVGETLTGEAGRWDGRPTPAYDFQWLRCDKTGERCTAIPRATATEYRLTAKDERATIRLRVTATNRVGTETETSDATPLVVPAPIRPTNLDSPTVTWKRLSDGDDQFTANPGVWSGTRPIAFNYRWQQCPRDRCVDIAGETSATYVRGAGQPACDIRVVVTASNAAGKTEATSDVLPCIG